MDDKFDDLETIVVRLLALSRLADDIERSIVDFWIVGRLITCDRGTPRALADGLERLVYDLSAIVTEARAEAAARVVRLPTSDAADRPSAANVIPLRPRDRS